MENTKQPMNWQGQNKKRIPELRAALNSAESADETLKIFKKIEAKLKEHDLGLDCSIVAQKLFHLGQDPLKILSFAKRALNIALRDETSAAIGIHRSSMAIGSLLNLLGFASFELNRFNESLGYLNWADRNLSNLALNDYGYDVDNFVLKDLRVTNVQLSRVKDVMGKGDEVVFHLKKVLEIDEKILGKDCVELGDANKDVADAYLEIKNYKEALPFGLEALEIYKKHLSDDSKEITMVRVSLVSIYLGLEEYGNALEHNRLSLGGLKCMGDTSLLIKAEGQGGHILFAFGRYEEAIAALKHVASQPENAGNQQARAFASMAIAKAFCELKRYADARKYIKVSVRILEKKGLDVGTRASGFMDMASLYEEMKEYEVAISLVQKALNIPELPQEHLANCSFGLFQLVKLSGTKENRLSSLEEVVQKLKENFGPEHCHVGKGYLALGYFYLELGRPEMAADLLVRAKDIFDASFGPYHSTSLTASRTLSLAYEDMESYDLAIGMQEKVVKGFKKLGVSELDRVNDAVQTLNRMKGGAIRKAAQSHQSEDGR